LVVVGTRRAVSVMNPMLVSGHGTPCPYKKSSFSICFTINTVKYRISQDNIE